MAIELTPQEKLKLLMNSNKAYIENCEKIVNKEGELIPFKLNKAQNILNDIISDLEKNKKPVRIIILKARQMGLSTYSEGYIFKKTSTQRYKKGTIIAHEDKASQNLYNMYRTFYDNLPSIVQPMIRRSNSQEMLFENPTQDQEEKRINPGLSSKVMVSTAKNVNTGRSATIHYLHMCLGGDSKIVLSDGSTKAIRDIEIGDKVITSTGKIAPVTVKSNNGEKQTYELKCWTSGEAIYPTEEHKILTIEGYKKLKDITNKDYLAMPDMRPTNEIKTYKYHLKNLERKQNGGTRHTEDYEFELNYDFGYFLGYYLAEGHVKKGLGQMEFAYNKDEKYILKALKGTFGLETSLKHYNDSEKGINRGRTKIYGKFLASAVDSICGRVEEKHIPEWFFKTNKRFLRGVLDGYLDGDGSKCKKDRKSFVSIHEKIARQIQRILYSLELGACSIKENKRYRYEKRTKNIFVGSFNGDTIKRYNGEEVLKQHKATKYKIVNGIVYCKVKYIKKHAMETVYDIEVGHSDHNYQTTTCMVSNSEVAFWDNPDVLCLGLLQCVPRVINSAVIIESTANGVGDWFYNTWQLAEKGENAFIPVFLPWFIQDEYSEEFETENERIAFENSLDDYEKWLLEYANNLSLGKYKCSLTLEQLKWRRYAIKNLCNNDTEQFQQEYPATAEEAFVASGRPRFDIKALKEYLLNTKEGIRGYLRNICGVVSFIEDPKGYVTIYKEPNPNKYYCVGADVAEGLEKGDYSVGIVGSDELNIDAIWHGHIDPDLFGKELVNLATFYNQAYLGVESNNHGLTTLKAILREDYMNIYYSKMHDKATDKITQKIGWVTSNKTKPLMIDKLAEFVREKYLGIPSKLIVKEMLSYVIDEKGKTNAQEGSHDDTVMATAIWLQLVLEGKGDTYVPTDNEPTKESIKRNTFIPNSIDDDIEDDTDKEDYSMECCY